MIAWTDGAFKNVARRRSWFSSELARADTVAWASEW